MSMDKPTLMQDDALTLQLYQQVLQATGYAIISFNDDGIVVYATDSMYHLTGYHPNEIVGLPFIELIHRFSPDDANGQHRFNEEFIIRQSLTHAIVTKDGDHKWIEYNIISTNQDEIHALVKDVTQQYLAEQALEQQIQERAQQYEEIQTLFERVNTLEKLKSDMIRVAAHDLRSPLSVFVTHLDVMTMELLETNTPPDKTQLSAHLEDMRQATKRMRRIIDDILSLERIEQHAQHAEYTPIDLVSIVRGIFNDHQLEAVQNQQEYCLICPEEHVLIQGDIAQLREAIANLISNALKYTPTRGNVQVHVKPKGDIVRFEVVDSGYGIPKDKQESLFQPFYRAKSKETRHIEGTGLGLYLVKNIVERHHGTLVFKSVPGKGSHFGFELPLIMH